MVGVKSIKSFLARLLGVALGLRVLMFGLYILLNAGLLLGSCSPQEVTIAGIVADGRYPYGSLVGIPNATIDYKEESITTDEQGYFNLTLPDDERDPILEIKAPGYIPYYEKPSHMVEGAFHLIPEDLYRGVYLILWNPEHSNPHSRHRKWEQQTEFVIVQTGASKQQIETIINLLATDEYRKMTGGRFTSAVQPTMVDHKPTGHEREGKTVISFAPGIIPGGIAHSEDRNGVINYAEITWDTTQVVDANIFWHEMVHTVTAGGHINEWPSVVSEVQGTGGHVTEKDEQILNCIYNSPPGRAQPAIPSTPIPIVNQTTHGRIRWDEIWRGEIHIIGDIIVEKGFTLTIEPGTKVFIAANQDLENLLDYPLDMRQGIRQELPGPNPDYQGIHPGEPFRDEGHHISILIYGSLHAVGTPEQMITITSDSPTPGIYDWNFFNFDKGVLSYCIMEYYRCFNPGNDTVVSHNILRHVGECAIGFFSGQSALVEYNSISYAGHELIGMEDSSPTIRNNDLGPNPKLFGIVIDGGSPEIVNNTIEGCGQGIFFLSPPDAPIIEKNEFLNNTQDISHGYSIK